MKILINTLLLLTLTACISHAQIEEFPAPSNIFKGEVTFETDATVDGVATVDDLGVFGNMEVWDFWDFKVAGQFTGAADFLAAVTVETIAGVNIGTGVDQDMDLITGDVTGAPTLSWNETKSMFESNHGIYMDNPTGGGGAIEIENSFNNSAGITNIAIFYSDRYTYPIGTSITTFPVISNFMRLTAVGSETIATITNAQSGTVLYLSFNNSNVTITDDNSGTADTIDLSAAFTGAADTILTLIYDGTSWLEVSRSVN